MKVILAIGHPKVESAIEEKLPSHCEVVGVATYREAILNKLRENPTTDVVLIRDNLQGEVKILTLIHQIRAEFDKCRIILMTKNREAGDPFLSAVVSYAVWDIILGYKTSVSHMVDYILNPRTFKDVERFQKRVLIDESTPTPEIETPVESQPSTPYPSSFDPSVGTPATPFPMETDQPGNPSLTTFPTSSSESGGVRKGSMREQLFKQMEASVTPQTTTELPSEPFVFETFESASSEPTFVFDSHLPPVTESIYPQAEIPISPHPSFVIEEEPVAAEIPIPKFEFKTAKAAPMEEESVAPEPKKPKLFSTKDIESIDKPLVGHRPAFNNKIKNSPIVMSLVGFKGGVGTSQTAFNLAVHLARHQNRVLYVELNDHSLPLTYLYNLSTLRGGLEDALRAAESSSVQEFSAYVTRFKDLKQTQREKDMQLLLKPYPDTLDFITFSHFFVHQEKEAYYPEHLKGLLSDLLLSEGYQYIILDVNVHSNPVLVSQALRSSKYICPVITQDMVSVGQSVECLKAIHQHQFPLHHKVQFILNRYDNTCHSDKAILKWINHELPFKSMGIWTIPDGTHAYNKANDKSKPVVLASPPKPILQAFETLHNYLKTM